MLLINFRQKPFQKTSRTKNERKWLRNKENYDGKVPSLAYIYQRYNGPFHTEKRYREEMKRRCVKHIQEMPIKEVERMESFLTENIN